MADEAKTITIKFHCYHVPHFTIHYEDKDDLFEKFQKKLKTIGLHHSKLSWGDTAFERMVIGTPGELIRVVDKF
ncbi:hypothetical protein Aduo_000623 [Ancylostoma duodenale]